jgi:hypothetical protein
VDVYKIAVEIALAGGLAQALTGIAGQMTGLHGQINGINKALGGWGDTLALVAGAAGLGLMVKGVDEVFESVKKLSHELSEIQKMGTTPEQYRAVRAAAIDVTRNVPGVTEAEAVNLYGSMQGMLRPEEALQVMTPLARLTQSIGASTGDYEDANKSVYSMVRSADLMGQLSDPNTKMLDVDRMERFLDIANRVSIATHGAIGPGQWLGMAQQGGPALRAMTADGLYGSALVAQAMGAQRFGTASMSMMQQFAGGTMFTRNAESLQAHGLLNAGEWTKDAGRVILSDAAKTRLMDMIKSDPLDFVQRLMKDYAAKGITSPDEQIKAIFSDFGRQTTQREVSDVLMNINQMIAEREQIKKALGANDATTVQNAKDIETALHNLGAAFENLKTAIGGSDGQIGFLVNFINSITGALRVTTELARNFSISKPEPFLNALSGGLIGGVVTLINALGWLGNQGESLAKAAAAIRSTVDAISGFIAHPLDGAKKLLSPTPGWSLKDFGPEGHGLFHVPDSERGGLPSGLLRNNSFVAPPSRTQQPITITTALNIDGRSIAQEIASEMVDMSTFPTTAPYPDGHSLWQSPQNAISRS